MAVSYCKQCRYGAVWSGFTLFAQTYLSENLGSLRIVHTVVAQSKNKVSKQWWNFCNWLKYPYKTFTRFTFSFQCLQTGKFWLPSNFLIRFGYSFVREKLIKQPLIFPGYSHECMLTKHHYEVALRMNFKDEYFFFFFFFYTVYIFLLHVPWRLLSYPGSFPINNEWTEVRHIIRDRISKCAENPSRTWMKFIDVFYQYRPVILTRYTCQ